MVSRKVKTNIKNPKRVEEQRSKIVRAAIKLVIEKGSHETSVREIGQAAGLTQGTLYNYIRSKGDILYLICDAVVTSYLGAVENAIARLPAGPEPDRSGDTRDDRRNVPAAGPNPADLSGKP